MWTKSIGAAVGMAAIASGASTALAHTLDEAEETLYGLGYYNVRVERASLPYSFNACKRDSRYHIHVDYYGTLVQVDRLGPCDDYADDRRYYSGRSPYDRYRDRRDGY